MSGFAVIYRRDGARAQEVDLAPMMRAIAQGSPHGGRSWSRGNVAFAHVHVWTTAEEQGKHQPLATDDGSLVIVLDGRLDNREELAALLGTGAGPTLSDAGLILAAYRRWGQECFQRLLGSFAVVIGERDSDTLICARDVAGECSLFYSTAQGYVAVASEEAALLALADVAKDLDEVALAHYLSLRVQPPGRTFWRSIRELPAAHSAIITRTNITVQRYWSADTITPLTGMTDDEYAARFLDALTASVRCRIHGDVPVAVMMSGGLDSTAVAALAAREAAGTGRRVSTVSAVFPELPACDESAFIAEMAQRLDLDSTLVPCDDAYPLSPAEARPHDPGRPDADPHRLMEQRLYRAAAGRGAGVLLTGLFGDDLYRGAEMWLADLLAEGRWREAVGQMAEQVQQRGLGSVVTSRSLRETAMWLLGRKRAPGRPDRQPWLTDQAYSLVGRAWESVEWPVRRPDQGRALLAGMAAVDAAREARFAARCGIELRHPYRDRRLIEFVLALPAHQLYNRGRSKYILRTAMRGILPRAIVERPKQAMLGALFQRGVTGDGAAKMREVLSHPQAVWPRYVRPGWLWAVLDRLGRGGAGIGDEAEASVLWRCVSVELWLHPRAAWRS